MATCLDLTYSKAVSTALAVEAKNVGHGKSKGFGLKGQIKDLRRELGWWSDLSIKIVLRLAHLHIHSNNLSLFVPLLPPLLPFSRVPLVLVSLLFPVLLLVASIVESPDTSSRTAHNRSKIKPTFSRTLEIQTNERGTWPTLQRARISRKRDIFIIPKWLLHQKASRWWWVCSLLPITQHLFSSILVHHIPS